MKKNKVLITGVAGLVGSHLSRYLLDKGYDVIGVDNLSGGYLDYVDKRLIKRKKFYKINIINSSKIERVFKKYKPDFVYHLAAYAAEGLSPFIRNFNYSNNLLCSINIINECIKNNVKKIIFTSSMAVYGDEKTPFKETQIPKPADPYGIAKYSIEMDLKQAYNQFGLKYSILRPHNIIGINQNIWDKYRNVIGIWVREIIAGKTINIFGDGQQKRAFSDIECCLETMESLMTKGDCDIFNIGADKEYKIKDVAELTKKIALEFGFKTELKYLEQRHEVKNAYCSHEKARKVLGFKDNTDVEKCIRKIMKWAIQQPKRKVKDMNYEIDKGMYSSWK